MVFTETPIYPLFWISTQKVRISNLLTQQAELLWLVIVGAYLDQEINLGKAAELLGMHRLELQEQFITQGIPLRLGVETIEEAHAEYAAISQWNLATHEKGFPE